MIKNRTQYELTCRQAGRFASSIARLNTMETLLSTSIQPSLIHPTLLQAERDALKGQLDTLIDELYEYETRSPWFHLFDLVGFFQDPEMLFLMAVVMGLFILGIVFK